MQVNSLGLTESQPENNVQRIVLEALAVTLGRNARARAIQLPAWNEALGLPRPWDQQWSLRIQQVLAYETDLLEYPDIFEGSKVMDGLVAELRRGRARGDGASWPSSGGAVEAVPYMKAQLVESHRERDARGSRRGELKVVGAELLHRDRALAAAGRRGRRHPASSTRRSSASAIEALERVARRSATRPRSSARSTSCARGRRRRAENIMPATIAAAAAGATTGEWARPLRDVFGDYRAPTGVGDAAARAADDDARRAARRGRARVARRSAAASKILVGKPGLDGHSNGAEQIAVRARDAGMDVVYEGIRLTPAQIARIGGRRGRPRGRPLDPLRLAPRADPRRAAPSCARRAPTCPVVVGGIIPDGRRGGAARGRRRRASTRPKDFELTRIMGDIVELVAERHGVAAPA